MSTLDSLANSAATIFTMDFYKPFIKKDASSKHLIKIGRIFTVAVIIIACLATPMVENFGEGLYKFIQICWGVIQPGIVAAFFLGLVSNRITPLAVTVGMLFNIPLYVFLLYQFPDVAFLHHMAICFVYVCLIMVGISIIKPETQEIIYPERQDVDTRLTLGIKVWSIIIVLSTALLYYIFR